MTKLALPLAAALGTLAVTAAAFDMHSRRIPNPLVIAGVAAGIALQSYLYGWQGLRASSLGLVVGFALLLPLFLLRGMGGGDVKLMAALGAIAGPINTLVIFVFTAIFGGVLAAGLILWKGDAGVALRNIGFILSELLHLRAPHLSRPDLSLDSSRSLKLPYAVPIALGCLLFLLL